MKALLKTGEWVTIDTACLFNNQYNTNDGRRIFDKDIKKITDDARINMGKCKYCGAMVRRGEEEKHFEERENKGCKGCFWYRKRITDRKVENEITENNGERVTIRTVKEKFEMACTYKDESHPEVTCTNKRCRASGIAWFTPENTFFLKYPNGFESIPKVDLLANRGFMVSANLTNAPYFKKLGSYTLVAVLSYKDGKPVGIENYRLYNCRRDYSFRYENNELFTDKYTFGWRKVKTLEGVPDSVMDAIKKICG